MNELHVSLLLGCLLLLQGAAGQRFIRRDGNDQKKFASVAIGPYGELLDDSEELEEPSGGLLDNSEELEAEQTTTATTPRAPRIRRRPTRSPMPVDALFRSDALARVDPAPTRMGAEPPPPSGLRLNMISLTSDRNILARVPFVEPLVMSRAGPLDRISYVCMRKCAEVGRNSSRNMVEMPGRFSMSVSGAGNDTYEVSRCWRWPKKRACSNYEVAALKQVWGFIHEVRRFMQLGPAKMPRYWMIRDDDTFVHIPNLFAAMEERGAAPPFDPFKNRTAWVSDGPCNVCGGAGMVFTNALAVELATTYADRWLEEQREGIERESFYGDTHMPKVIGWVEGAEIIRIPHMSPFSVADKARCNARNKGCIKTPECACAPAARMATWHMKPAFKGSVEILRRLP